jgi:lipoprotein-anchoring transpeptidase ErfK/SrfK
MERLAVATIAVTVLVFSAVAGARSQTQQPCAPESHVGANDPVLASLIAALPTLDDKSRRGLALQVALDRAGFSPGEIDAMPGANTDRAMTAYKAARGTLDLGDAYLNPVVSYTITPEDVAGPFVERIPDDMMAKAALPALGYTSVLEMLGERFHANPKLLQRLNPDARFEAGERIVVPNVEPFFIPRPEAAEASAKTSGPARQFDKSLVVTVTDRTKTLEVRNGAGDVLFHAPVTTGSRHDPLPLGEWVVNGVGRNPHFNYNPDLFWDADPTHAKAKVAAGPNNPVGVVWIDLSKEHYGIHGTPEPSRIGYTESHGCIRLTNWDAMRVADLVGPGIKVILR